MARHDMPFRQVHLDFHTSEKIARIGAKFDPDRFADTLEAARVNSITCFARGHHGWIYYDTLAFPERRHPHLERNLLAEQIAACHQRGIRVPVYITVQWDHYTAWDHPEWLVMGPGGGTDVENPHGLYEPGFYRFLCVNTPYRDMLKAQVREVLDLVPGDGIFFDIVKPKDCSCRWCRQGMIEQGLDPSDPDVRMAYGIDVITDFVHEMSAFIRQIDPDQTIFYNSSHINPGHRKWIDAFSHLEIESLPSGGWGYLHFPLTMRYARNLGVDCLGMTGKFHTSWGDFHSYKNRAALEYECFLDLALGGKCSVGDQLHPEGELDGPTYELIGSVYSQVEAKEPWCRGARPVTDVGVLSPEEFQTVRHFDAMLPASLGATRMLQEARVQFDFIDSGTDFGRYKVLILPDAIPVYPALAEKLSAYVSGGGALIATGRSGLNPEGTAFALDVLGVKLVGDAPYSPDFIVPRGEIGEGLPASEHVMYLRGMQVEADGGEVLCETVVPYFNRAWNHFCSHRHTPSSGKVGYPAVVGRGRCVYFAHPLFTQYNDNAPRWCKQLLADALGILLPDPVLRVDGPSSLVATINAQPEQHRQIVHLLHYVPERRGQAFDVIEDVLPVCDVAVSVRADAPVQHVRCVPAGEELAFTQRDGRVEFTLPRLDGHQMIELR